MAVALAAFCEAWQQHYREPYTPTRKDCGQLRLFLEDNPGALAYLPLCFVRYLQDLDPFVAQVRCHDLTWFLTSGGFNKYRVIAPVLSAKEARGVAAGRQFVNGEGKHADER